MKQRILLTLTAIILVGTAVTAQTTQYPTGVSFKALFMDYQSQNNGSFSNFSDYHHGLEIGFLKNIQPNLNLVVPLKIGVVNSFPAGEIDMQHKTVYGLDAQIQYQFWEPGKQIVPYLMAGLGGVGESEGSFNMQAPLGAGVQFMVAENAYVNFQSEYRFSFSDDRNNLHHGLGFVYLFGNGAQPLVITSEGDKDGDGILDAEDLCPEIVGLAEHNGCPDRDSDGVPDYQDKCPDVVGVATASGCPDRDGDGVADDTDQCPDVAGVQPTGCPQESDTDGDGVPDRIDRCPDVAGTGTDGCPEADRDNDGVADNVDRCPDAAGTATTAGCPDRDNDGIADLDDSCPTKPGPLAYDGCPDTDGDGLHDGRDRCPNSAGPVSTGGCPEIKAEDRKTLDIAMRAVQFDTGRSTLKSESFDVLRQIADIMRRYPDYVLSISGHTDNTGKESANQKLSDSRAKACYEYLVTQGINSSRMSHVGYGESRPIADNNTLRGRTLNRRVEFSLSPGR